MLSNEPIIELLTSMIKHNKRGILASVISVQGSAYKREGAKMIIEPNGNYHGMISGGCLEADVVETAKEVLQTGKPLIKTYVLDEDLVWGLGLGCPGTVEILVEPVSNSEGWKTVANFYEKQEAFVICKMLTEFDSDKWLTDSVCVNRLTDYASKNKFTDYVSENKFTDYVSENKFTDYVSENKFTDYVSENKLSKSDSSKMLNGKDDHFYDQFLVVSETEVHGDWTDVFLQTDAVSIAKQKLSQQVASSEIILLKTSAGEDVRVFFDVYFPSPKLCIFGAGHDAIPLAYLSTRLGFQTTVIDPRPAFNTSDRFPTANCLLFRREQYEKMSIVDSRTYIVIMNHHLERDMEALTFSLQSVAHYVGMLGPKSRRDKILALLHDEGIAFSKDQLKKLFNPIGLDIGAETAEEIAVSIMAEITAVRNGHKGGFLREQSQIHRKPQIVVG